MDFSPGEKPVDLLHVAVLGSPHAHAHITRIDTAAAEAAPGVAAVLTFHDSPDVAVLDRPARGPQRRSGRHARVRQHPPFPRPARSRGHRRIPDAGGTCTLADRSRLRGTRRGIRTRSGAFPGAPLLHGDKGRELADRRGPPATWLPRFTMASAIWDRALADATAVVEGTWKTARVQHVALETPRRSGVAPTRRAVSSSEAAHRCRFWFGTNWPTSSISIAAESGCSQNG